MCRSRRRATDVSGFWEDVEALVGSVWLLAGAVEEGGELAGETLDLVVGIARRIIFEFEFECLAGVSAGEEQVAAFGSAGLSEAGEGEFMAARRGRGGVHIRKTIREVHRTLRRAFSCHLRVPGKVLLMSLMILKRLFGFVCAQTILSSASSRPMTGNAMANSPNAPLSSSYCRPSKCTPTTQARPRLVAEEASASTSTETQRPKRHAGGDTPDRTAQILINFGSRKVYVSRRRMLRVAIARQDHAFQEGSLPAGPVGAACLRVVFLREKKIVLPGGQIGILDRYHRPWLLTDTGAISRSDVVSQTLQRLAIGAEGRKREEEQMFLRGERHQAEMKRHPCVSANDVLFFEQVLTGDPLAGRDLISQIELTPDGKRVLRDYLDRKGVSRFAMKRCPQYLVAIADTLNRLLQCIQMEIAL